jgi:hypothetical protein
MAGRRIAEQERAVAEPMGEAYQKYYPQALEKQWGAMQMPAVRGMYAGQERGIGARASRYGLGGSGVEESRRRALAAQMGQQIGQLQFQQAGQYGQMARDVAGAGMTGLGLQTEQDRRMQDYWQRRTAQSRAKKEASRAREAQTWQDVARAGMDIGTAVATGGTSIPQSAAYWSDRARIRGGRR